jgi:CheY-like chemotaxis protein
VAEIDRQSDSQGGTRGRKILLVDDSDDLRELMESILTIEGYDVKTAPLAETALEIARAWRPDLVITDLFMPGIGGLELITRLRSDLAPVPPIVAISGVPESKDEALKRGAVRFETKPVSPEELLHIVEDALASEPAPRLRSPTAVSERRAATRAIGEAMLSRHLTEDPGFFAKIGTQMQVAARFFGQFSVLVFFLREGKLKLVASSDPTFPLDADATEILPIVNDVVETEAKIVVTAGISQWLAQQPGSGNIRFLAAVPYVLDRVVVGVLCLVDRVPHDFSSAAIGILEYMTRRSAAVMRGGPKFVDASGLLEPAAFGAFLHGSVILAQEAGHAFGFMMCEVAEVPRDGSPPELLKNLPAPSLMIGILNRHHLVAFAFAESVELVRERLALTRRLIESRLTVRHTVELTYEDPVPIMELDAFVVRSRQLLARAGAEMRGFLAVDARRRE